MEKATTILEGLLKECKTIRECFEVQNALVDGLTSDEELDLRAKYAGLTLEEAKQYQDALKTVKRIESKPVERQLNKVMQTLLNVVSN